MSETWTLTGSIQRINTRFYRILSMMKTGGKTTALSQPLYLMKVPWFKLKPREWFEYYFKPLSMSDLALWRTRISLMTTNTESLSKKKLYFLNFSVLSEWSYAKHTVYYIHHYWWFTRQNRFFCLSLYINHDRKIRSFTFHRSKPYFINFFFGSHRNISKMIQD